MSLAEFAVSAEKVFDEEAPEVDSCDVLYCR